MRARLTTRIRGPRWRASHPRTPAAQMLRTPCCCGTAPCAGDSAVTACDASDAGRDYAVPASRAGEGWPTLPPLPS